MKYKIKPTGDGVTFALTLTTESFEDYESLHDLAVIKMAESSTFIMDVCLAGHGKRGNKSGTVPMKRITREEKSQS